ncbi:TPA: leucyl aminopeptidase [Neisseria weaveri]
MEFSIKAEKLQPNQAGALLYVCTDACPCSENNNDETAALLCASLEEGQAFAETKIIEAGRLKSIGVVRMKDTQRATVEKAAKEAAAWAQKQEQLNVCLEPFCAVDAPLVAEVFATTLGNAVYRFERYKQETSPAKLTAAAFYHSQHAEAVQAAVTVAEALVYGMSLCRDLGNAAPNECTPKFLAKTAKAEAKKLGASAKILEKDYIKENMGSFWSVAKGSKEKPYLVELSYFGAEDKEAAPVVLVGKGITFDSGGISLKPGENMDEMKFDMCGAATVIGTFCAAVKMQLPINLIAVVPTCENMPSGGANKPGDIVTSMKGLTIEVLNTDAEGRLILCDALTYAEQFNPKAVIDVATLTGACIIALGHEVSGLMANNQELADQLLAAAEDSGDKAWQLPLFDNYKEQLKSNFADLQNIGGRAAGTITAATFLSYFTENYNWAHLDIAGTAWKSGKEKGASGRPVPLLLNYLRNLNA